MYPSKLPKKASIRLNVGTSLLTWNFKLWSNLKLLKTEHVPARKVRHHIIGGNLDYKRKHKENETIIAMQKFWIHWMVT